MPTQLVSQPLINRPNQKNGPLLWQFLTDEHIISVGRFLEVSIAFGNSTNPGVFVAAADGDILVLRGVSFTVDNSVPYTATTFKADISSEDTARNVAEMLKLNYQFKDFSISVDIDSDSSQWAVFLKSYEKIIYSDMDVVTDWDALLMTGGSVYGFSILNGLPPVLRDYKMWYQVFDPSGPVSSMRRADAPFLPNYPFVSVIRIDANETARGLVYTTRPDLLQTEPVADENYQRLIYLKAGNIILINCEPQFGEVIQTAQIMFVNAVFQLHETLQFFPHAPNGNLDIRFLTNRRDDLSICGNAYEWVHIWMEKGIWKTAPFKVQYKFYGTSGLLDTFEQDIEDDTDNYRKAWVVPIGTANLPVANNKPPGTTYYTVQVIATRVLEDESTLDTPYSQIITRRLASCNCKAAEVYYLEDRGSWRTVIFEKLEARETRQVEIEFERELNWNDTAGPFLYTEGGTYNQAQLAEAVFILSSEKITEYNRDHYEQFVRSQEMYIRSTTETGREVIRRILIERSTYRTFERGEVTRLIVAFRFNTKLQLQ